VDLKKCIKEEKACVMDDLAEMMHLMSFPRSALHKQQTRKSTLG
jgi:hypothetical protein